MVRHKTSKKFNVLKYKDRIIQEANLIAYEGMTVRQVSKENGHCKSGVHTDCTEMLFKLKKACPEYAQLYRDTKKALAKNKAECTARGGEATKQVYAKRRAMKEG